MLEQDLTVTRSVLDALAVRSKVVLHNLANQNTPGYKAYRVEFEELLRRAHETGENTGEVHARVIRDTSGRPGINNVSMLEELGILQKVALLQDVFTRRAAGYFNRLNSAIRGR
jgi:flagellar basal-body rod protein FlgB